MAGNKKTRKKSSVVRRKGSHITAVLNTAMHKFYMMGDMNHKPASFHVSDIKMHLKGKDLDLALIEMCKFLYDTKQTWVFVVYHFFKVDDKLEVVPTVMTMKDVDLKEVADDAEENIRMLRDSVIEPSGDFCEENYAFYGYYINYGDNLLMEQMEPDIISALLKVNADLTDIKEHVCTCDAESILRAIASEKFSLVDSERLKTSMVESGEE